MRAIRPIAIAIIEDRGRLLVFEGADRVNNRVYYRPLGGGIEGGELAADSVVREVREEIGAEIRVTKSLGVIENLFTLNGESRHEIVFVFAATLVDGAREQYNAREADGSEMVVSWVALEEFRRGRVRLVPEGLLERLA